MQMTATTNIMSISVGLNMVAFIALSHYASVRNAIADSIIEKAQSQLGRPLGETPQTHDSLRNLVFNSIPASQNARKATTLVFALSIGTSLISIEYLIAAAISPQREISTVLFIAATFVFLIVNPVTYAWHIWHLNEFKDLVIRHFKVHQNFLKLVDSFDGFKAEMDAHFQAIDDAIENADRVMAEHRWNTVIRWLRPWEIIYDKWKDYRLDRRIKKTLNDKKEE